MSFIAKKLQTGFDLPEVVGLMHFLSGDKLTVSLFDTDGEIVARCGKSLCGNSQCKQIREKIIDRLLVTRKPCRENAPCGGSLAATPISQSSMFFGGMMMCSHCSQQTVTCVDPVLNSITSFVARSNFYELEVQSLTNDLSLRYEELALLYEIGESIPIRAPIPKVINYIIEQLRSLISADTVCWVPNAGNAEMQFYWMKNKDAYGHLQDKAEAASRVMERRVRESLETTTVTDPAADEGLRACDLQLAAVVAFPVATEDEYYGSLVLTKLGEARQFHSGEAMLVTAAARRSGTVIRNAILYSELKNLFVNTITTLVRIIEGKDAYTRGHSERVSAFSKMLGDILDLPLDEKEALSWSSLLHDIGKIKVPENILQKPGSLDDDEFAVIKRHPGFGAEMLSPISQLAHCLPDIRHHHERIDGRGYPDQLSGDEIPMRARIIAVADTFDALTSDRCYRPRFGIDKALSIIEEVSGTQLWPDAAEALVSNKDAILEYLSSTGAPVEIKA